MHIMKSFNTLTISDLKQVEISAMLTWADWRSRRYWHWRTVKADGSRNRFILIYLHVWKGHLQIAWHGGADKRIKQASMMYPHPDWIAEMWELESQWKASSWCCNPCVCSLPASDEFNPLLRKAFWIPFDGCLARRHQRSTGHKCTVHRCRKLPVATCLQPWTILRKPGIYMRNYARAICDQPKESAVAIKSLRHSSRSSRSWCFLGLRRTPGTIISLQYMTTFKDSLRMCWHLWVSEVTPFSGPRLYSIKQRKLPTTPLSPCLAT